MWAAGQTTMSTDQLAATRDRAVDLERRYADANAHAQECQQGVDRAAQERNDASRDQNIASSEERSAVGEQRSQKSQADQAREAVQSESSHLRQEGLQLDQQWRSWSSENDKAQMMMAMHNRRMASFITREVMAFFEEAQQKLGEIERAMYAAYMRFQAAQMGVSNPAASSQLSFNTYTNFHDCPQNDALSELTRVRAQYQDLINRGQLLMQKQGDSTVRDRMNTVLGRLQKADDTLKKAQDELSVTQSAETAARNNYQGALQVFEDAQKDARDVQQELSTVRNDLQKNTDLKQAEYDEKVAKQQQQQQGQQPGGGARGGGRAPAPAAPAATGGGDAPPPNPN